MISGWRSRVSAGLAPMTSKTTTLFIDPPLPASTVQLAEGFPGPREILRGRSGDLLPPRCRFRFKALHLVVSAHRDKSSSVLDGVLRADQAGGVEQQPDLVAVNLMSPPGASAWLRSNRCGTARTTQMSIARAAQRCAGGQAAPERQARPWLPPAATWPGRSRSSPTPAPRRRSRCAADTRSRRCASADPPAPGRRSRWRVGRAAASGSSLRCRAARRRCPGRRSPAARVRWPPRALGSWHWR